METCRYMIELAKLAYDVILLDLTPKLLQIAETISEELKWKVKQLVQASIHDLSAFKVGTFDAVLCLEEALNHVTCKEHREKAIVDYGAVYQNGLREILNLMR